MLGKKPHTSATVLFVFGAIVLAIALIVGSSMFLGTT